MTNRKQQTRDKCRCSRISSPEIPASFEGRLSMSYTLDTFILFLNKWHGTPRREQLHHFQKKEATVSPVQKLSQLLERRMCMLQDTTFNDVKFYERCESQKCQKFQPESSTGRKNEHSKKLCYVPWNYRKEKEIMKMKQKDEKKAGFRRNYLALLKQINALFCLIFEYYMSGLQKNFGSEKKTELQNLFQSSIKTCSVCPFLS